MPEAEPITVAIAGLGAIGYAVARAIDDGISGLALTAVSARRLDRAAARVADFSAPPRVVEANALADHAQVIVECVPAAAFADVAGPALRAGRTLVTVSGGALLSHPGMIDLARAQGGRIVLATGALLGLDAVRAAAEGAIDRVTMVTRKPPASLADAPHLTANNIDLEKITEATKIFDGSAREGALGFPANVNVAAALSLAGIGPDRTRLQVWADPALTRNSHAIEVEADSARFTMTIENVPSAENPRTGKITALSVIATLRRMVDTVVVGT